MKIFTTKQIAEIDKYTIENEPIADIDLMERASLQIVNWLIYTISNEKPLSIFAGPGNNGGDAMAIARMMADHDYTVNVYLLNLGKVLQGSPAINWQRLVEQGKAGLFTISNENDFPVLNGDELVLDGLFGSGLSRPLDGISEKLVAWINQSVCHVIAIDIPSGLLGEDNSQNDLSKVILANRTFTFQFPKLSFFFPEHDEILGEWEVLPIGLHPGAINHQQTTFHFLTDDFISGKIIRRKKFSHKGTFGHALLIAGSYGKMGAAVLAAKAGLRTGCGLLTCHVPHEGYKIIQVAVPEAMCSIDPSDLMFTEFPDLSLFSAVGAGPGIGQKCNCQRALKLLLLAAPGKLVLDADALNILSENKEWLDLLPENTILTPHPKEFERLAGKTNDSYTRLRQQVSFSIKYKVIVALKGAHTCISFPDGRVFFNTTGNPGMATAGSGDVLTGMILGLLAQEYSAEDAVLIAVYLHGLAGNLAAQERSEYSLVAGDIIEYLGRAFLLTGDAAYTRE
ncbi:MAG: NAD(P)H-hydrate dehydratase [Prolixibacteraceae bacterium]|jgi:NAD(P)H-hydrate epimerase|nr:NAD(P)H-hydrate dehydratase [Prolixibacteraceae bacterium]